MKKAAISIVGFGLIISGILYFIINKGNNVHKKTSICNSHTPSKNADKSVKGVFKDTESDELGIAAARVKAASAINERHQEAAKIIKDSVNTIFSTDKKSGIHADELSSISDELDTLLKEND